MSLDVTVRINDVLFRSRENESAPDGFYIDDEGFEGWNDGADVLRDAVNIPQGHGAFDVPGFMDARVVSLTGTCWAATPERLTWFRSQLTGLLAGGDSGQVVVVQPGETQWATARLAAKTTFAIRAEDIRSALFQIQLWFPNPRKFGESRTFTSGEPAHHFGNIPATPVFTVSGTMSSYAIAGPGGKQFAVSRALVAGSPHTIDMATGLLSINGAVVYGGVSRADTWAVPGGAQVSHALSGSGTGTLSAAVTDTFI